MCNYTCAPNYGDCDGDKSNGCEVFLGNDVNNCGACNNTCVNSLNQEWICEISDNTGLGACAPKGPCLDGFADCNSIDGNGPPDGCETDITSAEYCGRCDHNCTSQLQANHATVVGIECIQELCVAVCAPGRLDCNGFPFDGCENTTC
eukprot:m.81522 g.81522  ORF g.81522 m.81522 type:complete len:148 (-) comp12814_c0_seq14:193-636(-)